MVCLGKQIVDSSSIQVVAVSPALPVPEPETGALMLAGLAAFAFIKRKEA